TPKNGSFNPDFRGVLVFRIVPSYEEIRYIDNSQNLPNPNGTASNPFSNFSQALPAIESALLNNSTMVYFANTTIPYQVSMNYFFNNSNPLTFTSNVTLPTNLECLWLPII